MVKHIVMFKFKEDTPENKKEQLIEIKTALDLLPTSIPEIANYEVGINISESDRAYDLVIVSSFETTEKLDIYRNHPAHLVAVKLIAKYKETVKAVDYII